MPLKRILVGGGGGGSDWNFVYCTRVSGLLEKLENEREKRRDLKLKRTGLAIPNETVILKKRL